MLTTNAIVRDGTLVFERPLNLPDDSRVFVSISPADWRDRLKAGLQSIRTLSESELIHSEGERFTRDQLHGRD